MNQYDLLIGKELDATISTIPDFRKVIALHRIDGPGSFVLLYETLGDVRVCNIIRDPLDGHLVRGWDHSA